jgi:hypothetical protein
LSVKRDNEAQRADRMAQLIEHTKLVDEIETLRRQNKLLIQTAENTNLLEHKVFKKSIIAFISNKRLGQFYLFS